jgi:hypothetical protein
MSEEINNGPDLISAEVELVKPPVIEPLTVADIQTKKIPVNGLTDDIVTPGDIELDPELDNSPEAALKRMLETEEKPSEPKKEEKPEETKKDEKIVGQPIEFKDFIQTLENTKVLHKIDGQMVEIDVKEAVKKVLNDYSGHQTVDKRFTELDKYKKEVYNIETKQKEVLDNFNKFREAGDIVGGYTYIGSLSGTPSYVIKEQLVAALMPEIERRYGLSQEQLQAEYLKEENQYLMQQREAEFRQRSEAQAIQERLDTVTKLRETHKIDEKSWDIAFKELDSTLPPNEPITPEMVIAKVQTKQAESKTVEVVSTLSKKYSLDEADAKGIETVIKQYPQLSQSEVEEILKESLEIKSRQETEKKLAEKMVTKQTKQTSSKTEEQDLEDFAKQMQKRLGLDVI